MERKEERKTSNLFPSHGKKKEKNPTQIQVMHKFKIPDTNLVQKQNVVCTQQEVLSLATQMLKLNFWLAHSDFFM